MRGASLFLAAFAFYLLPILSGNHAQTVGNFIAGVEDD